MLRELYGDDRPPGEVLVQGLPDEPKVWEEWLERRREASVSLRVPQRGVKRRLLETAQANAREEFGRQVGAGARGEAIYTEDVFDADGHSVEGRSGGRIPVLPG